MVLLKRRLLRLYKTAQAVFSTLVFGFPARKLRVVGVTGTDGKTTTVHLIIKAIESAGYTVGAVSSIQHQVGTRVWTNTSKLTTPGPWGLQKLLAHMVRAGCHYAVIECSSHRLDQNGLWGIPFDVAVITNITREHFDYHRDFEDYAHAKRRLFRLLGHQPKQLPFRRSVDPGGRIPTVTVANLDDDRAARMLTERADLKYGFTLQGGGRRQSGVGGNVRVITAQAVVQKNFPTPYPPRDLSREAQGAKWEASAEWGTQHPTPSYTVVRADDREALLDLKLPGIGNLQNALAAIAVGVSQGIELARVTRALSEVQRVPGRMEAVARGQRFRLIIDYAVTPAAFEALYAEARTLKAESAKLIHVFGAAGGRDRGKRSLLGEIAARHADLIILTDEDPFHEHPEQILDDIEQGVRRGGLHPLPTSEVEQRNDGSWHAARGFLRIRDRRLAIRAAVQYAQPGDVVLLTGKGAEETMAVGKKRIWWNDRAVVEEELRS